MFLHSYPLYSFRNFMRLNVWNLQYMQKESWYLELKLRKLDKNWERQRRAHGNLSEPMESKGDEQRASVRTPLYHHHVPAPTFCYCSQSVQETTVS